VGGSLVYWASPDDPDDDVLRIAVPNGTAITAEESRPALDEAGVRFYRVSETAWGTHWHSEFSDPCDWTTPIDFVLQPDQTLAPFGEVCAAPV
jgi:hypothetical protein